MQHDSTAQDILLVTNIAIVQALQQEASLMRVFIGVNSVHIEIEAEYANVLCCPVVFSEDVDLSDFQQPSYSGDIDFTRGLT